THGELPHTRLPIVRLRPLGQLSGSVPRRDEEKPDGQAIVRGARRLRFGVTVGSCATSDREPSQGREAAALSGNAGGPQIAWPSRQSERRRCASGVRARERDERRTGPKGVVAPR